MICDANDWMQQHTRESQQTLGGEFWFKTMETGAAKAKAEVGSSVRQEERRLENAKNGFGGGEEERDRITNASDAMRRRTDGRAGRNETENGTKTAKRENEETTGSKARAGAEEKWERETKRTGFWPNAKSFLFFGLPFERARGRHRGIGGCGGGRVDGSSV